MRDHAPQRVTRFNGLFDRGEDEVTPVDHFISCRNLLYSSRGFRTRRGSGLSLTKADIRRIAIYRITGQAQRLLVLTDGGNLYDSTNFSTPILTIAAMSDFSSVTMFNRAYITPHNGTTGLPGEKVYVYTGAGLARPAAGTAPTGFTLGAVDSATSGHVESGTHVFGVAYVTDSGYVSAPGGFVALNSVGGRKVDISSIALGPSYATGRVILATKRIAAFDGDFANQTYYFVPNGEILNNTDSTLTVDFYDADLQSDASYLQDQLAEIPAGVCITNYNSRLVVGGEDTNQSTLRVSLSGQPENIDGAEGVCNVNPGDAGSGIKNIYVHGEMLVACKSQRSYYTMDTGDAAAFWNKPKLVDGSVGAECHSIGKILDYGEMLETMSIIADRSGLRVFNGSFAPQALSWKIEDYWLRINKAAFHTVEVAIDPIACRIYVAIPLDAATAPNEVLYCDYTNGLAADKVKWSPWGFPVAPQSIVVDVDFDTKEPIFKYAGYVGNIYELDDERTNDFGNAIENWAEFPLLPHEESKKVVEGIYHFAGINVTVKGFGELLITLRNQNSSVTGVGVPITLLTAPGNDMFRLLNFKAPKCAVKLRLVNADEYMVMTKFALLSKWLWSEVATSA